MEVTDNRTDDATMLPELLSQIPVAEGLVIVTTDGAYDTRLCHAAILNRFTARGTPQTVPMWIGVASLLTNLCKKASVESTLRWC